MGRKVISLSEFKKDNRPVLECTPELDPTIESEIQVMRNKLGLTREDVITVAGDFYRNYPMLVEYVRSTDYLLKGKR